MPGIGAIWTRYSEAIRWISLGIGAFAAVTAAACVAWRMFRREPDANELERRRRDLLHGKGKIGDDGKLIPMDVKKGDKILYGKYSGTEIKIEGEEYLIMHQEDILGLLD